MEPYEINWLAVLVGALSSFAVGGLWYSPLLFTKPWLAAIGKTEEDMRAGGSPVLPFILAFVMSAITAIVLSVVVDWAGADTLIEGLLLGLVVGVGLIATAYVTTYTFEQRSWTLIGINGGHDILRSAVIGAIVGAWQ